jgi:2-succinyl-5-enolpyruvyl-6-hydroxy-3-cyclohexene-1-carboxylate synthase
MSAPNPSVAAAAAIIDELVRNRVTRVVIAPGSRSAALAMAAAAHPAVRLTVEIDERSAGFFAVGAARATGRPAVVITTSGTAVANLAPAIVEADIDAIPLIVITADRPPELHHVGANQTVDQVKMFGDRVRWFCAMGVPEPRADSNAVWRSTVCQAVARAMGAIDAVSGPVHVNLPLREPSVPLTDDGRTRGVPFEFDTSGRDGGRPWTDVASVRRSGVSVEAVEEERVVLAVAADLHLPALVEEATRHGWPVIAEPQSNARTAGSITTAHHLLQSETLIEELLPDVVIEIGRVGLSRPVRSFLDRAPRRVVIDRRWVDAARTAVSWGSEGIPWPRSSDGMGSWPARWAALEERARRALDRALDDSGLTEPRVARDTARAVPAGGRLVSASSMPIRDLDLAMAAAGTRVLSNRGASGIDGFVSTTLGIASEGPDPVVALAGDLSILHDANGFLARPRPNAVFVVVNNDGGGIFSFLPQARFPDSFETVFGTPHGRSFADLAGFHGLGHTLVEEATALIPAIESGIEGGGVHLVEVRTDRAANVEHHRALTRAVLEAL